MSLLERLPLRPAARDAFLSERLQPEANVVRALTSPEPHAAEVERVIADCSGGWAIDPHLGRVIAGAIVRLGTRSVLEFGAGSSSLLIARTLAQCGGGRLTSVEQNPSWCAETWADVEQIDGVDAEMVVSEVDFGVGRWGIYAQYGRAEVGTRGDFDLVVVDAPQFWFGRECTMEVCYGHLKRGAVILIDDAKRSGEKWAMYKWLKTYPGLRLVHLDETEKGYAVLVAEGTRKTFSLSAFVKGCQHGWNRVRAARAPVEASPSSPPSQ